MAAAAIRSQAARLSPARWIIWVADITGSGFSPGLLPYDFSLYGATSAADWSSLAGNGYVTSLAGEASVVGTIAPKVYDGTQTAVLQGSLQATGPRGELGTFSLAPGVPS